MTKHMMKCLFLVLGLTCTFAIGQQNVENLDFPKIKSSVNMPVRIPLSEISSVVNASVGNLIYQDDSYTDNDNDQFKIKVWKSKPIRLVGGTNQNILIEVPLKIWAEKGIGTLGMYTYQETTFETIMYFNTSVKFNSNWTISTQTVPNGFKWVTKPVLDYGKIKIPITPIVETQLKKQQADFCKVMDEKMASELNFQSYALMAWNLFNQPIEISEEYKTWLKVSPISVQVSPLTFYSNAIDLNLGIETYSETFTGTKPVDSKPITKVTYFKFVNAVPNQFTLQTTANIPYSEATAIANSMFLNKEFDFREGKSKIKVTQIKVYSEDNRIMIEAQTEGAVNGTSFISGIPVYDATRRKIVLTDTKYTLKTKNIVHKTGLLFFKGKIVKMIEDEYGIPTKEIEDSSKKSIEEAFTKEYYKGLKMSGKVYSLKPSKVVLTNRGITAIIDTNAYLRLVVQGL